MAVVTSFFEEEAILHSATHSAFRVKSSFIARNSLMVAKRRSLAEKCSTFRRLRLDPTCLNIFETPREVVVSNSIIK